MAERRSGRQTTASRRDDSKGLYSYQIDVICASADRSPRAAGGGSPGRAAVRPIPRRRVMLLDRRHARRPPLRRRTGMVGWSVRSAPAAMGRRSRRCTVTCARQHLHPYLAESVSV